MQQFTDKEVALTGEMFGNIVPQEELLKKLLEDPDELARTKAVHFGTRTELLNKKQFLKEEVTLEKLDARLEAIETKMRFQDGPIKVVSSLERVGLGTKGLEK